MYLAHLNWQQAKRAFAKDDLVAIIPIGSTEQYCVNYSPTGRCFYGLGIGNKILKQKKFSQCENVGIAIFNEDAKEIFK